MSHGQIVKLVTPDNPRLDGAEALVVEVKEWGCHVETSASATGRFRALWSEMEPYAYQELQTLDNARERDPDEDAGG